MDSETIDTVTGWPSKPYSGGYGGLDDLAEREFTGAVTDGTAWLFALNGRFVGVTGGTVESFEDADGTAYAAPDPSLPLLFAMRERGGETKAKYYTNDTPLSEADRTLSAGNFTGFIELSENVLSGDYYVVYHGGRRLACAFVGTRRETLTGEEAFERADDEVGIYEVRTVDVDVIDVPAPEPPDAAAASDAGGDASNDDAVVGGAAPAGDAGEAADATTEDDASDAGTAPADGVTIDSAGGPAESPGGAANAADGTAESDAGGTNEGARAADPADSSGATDADAADAADATARPAADATEGADANEPAEDGTAGRPATDAVAVPDAEAGTVEPSADDSTTDAATDSARGAATDPAAGAAAADRQDETAATPADRATPERTEQTRAEKRRRDAEPTDAIAGSESDPFSAEEQWRETRAIPSLDPDETGVADRNGRAGSESTGARESSRGEGGPRRARQRGSADDTTDASTAESSGPAAGESTADAPAESTSASTSDDDGARAAELRRDLQRARNAHEEVAGELAATREELSDARSEADRLREENERLEGRIETLQSELADARSRLSEGANSASAEAGRSVPPSRALDGTNLFVRYDSKGAGTLEKAHAGGATREEVNENLRLEVHTEFEAADAVVDGRPYGEWLADTIEYGFVEWVVRTLLYEIQDTRSEGAMRDLYDAIPKVDRAELDAVVDLVDEDGKKSEERRFDVALRDRMGDPLVVANVTDSREATTESMLDGLVEGSSSVADQYEGLAAAFHVTASYFEPGALEAVADATGGGLLSRGKQKSFVRLARKQGFHLCLVESRDGEFHVNVPEL